MANVEINDLTGKTTPESTDEAEIQETGGGTSYKATLSNLSKGLVADNIPNTPSGNIAATDIQAAIDELESEKLAAATTATLTNKTISTVSNTITVVEADISDLGTYLENVSEDTTPQLGGNLDVAGNKIVSTSNGNIDIEPNGTGNVLLGNFVFDADQTVGAGQDNYVLTYDNAGGLISLEASAGGGSGSMTTVKEGGVQLGGSDIVTLDFDGDDFNLTESPDTEVNITIAAASTSVAGKIEIATSAEALAVTSDTLAMTPLKTQLLIDDSEVGFTASRVIGAGSGDSAYTALTTAQLKTLAGYLTDVVDDTTPQLGGNLDVNSNSIVTTSNGDITLAPNGTGAIVASDKQLERAVMADYAVASTAATGSSTLTVNYALANDFTYTMVTNVVDFVISNPPPTGTYGKFTLQITQHDSAAKTLDWPAWNWAGGTTATLTATTSAIDEYVVWSRTGFDTAANIFIASPGQAFAP